MPDGLSGLTVTREFPFVRVYGDQANAESWARKLTKAAASKSARQNLVIQRIADMVKSKPVQQGSVYGAVELGYAPNNSTYIILSSSLICFAEALKWNQMISSKKPAQSR